MFGYGAVWNPDLPGDAELSAMSFRLQPSVVKLSVSPVSRLAEAPSRQAPSQLELWSAANTCAAPASAVDQHFAIGLEQRLAAESYRELDLSLDHQDGTIWCFMRPNGPPSFTSGLLAELISVRRTIQRMFASLNPGETAPIRYFVGGSRIPGIYNLGGDLGFFVDSIRARDRDALVRYAYDCVDVGYHMAVGFHLPIITIALVQGDALGGGLEGALSFNVLVAEKSAKFGLPEVLFNLFPGMGAFSFLSRKLDASRAEQMIMSGKLYSAGELHEMGLIDVLAEDGRGEEAVRDYIAHNRRQHAVRRRMRDIRMRVNPLTLEELRDVTEIWVDHAMRLEDADLRKMQRLMSAQLRRLNDMRPACGPVARRAE
jgi:DSF synthase